MHMSSTATTQRTFWPVFAYDFTKENLSSYQSKTVQALKIHNFKPLHETETNKRFHILVFRFSDKRYCSGRDGEKSENVIRERSKLHLSLRKGKPYLLAENMMFGRPRSSQEPRSMCVTILQRHDKTFALSRTEKQLLWDLSWNIDAGIRWRHTNTPSKGIQ